MSANIKHMIAQHCSGVGRLTSRIRPETVLKLARQAGWHALVIDGRTTLDKASLIEAVRRGFQFPAYAGSTWDSLEECLNDLSWLPRPGYLILFDSAHMLAGAQPETWATWQAILQDVGRTWQQQGHAFLVLIRGSGPLLEALSPIQECIHG